MIKLAPNLTLPPELAGRRTAVFGISGSGKSNTATVIIESLLTAGEQVVLIDPKGEGWGLLSKASGKPSNLDVIIFGEPNGHIPALDESHGPRLADFVVESGRSVVLSLLGFESDQSERRFVASFLRQLYRRKSKQAQPTRTLVVIEEAHLFVPESVRGDAAELAGAVQRIVRQGRSQGLGTLLVDQRPQDVSKRVITQCETLICHQLAHNLDRKALEEWVRGYDTSGRGKLFLESLASLQPGEAWVWSPGWLQLFERVQVRRRKTFDSGAAPDGSAAAKQVQRADVDLAALQSQLAEMVDKAKADDPKELTKRIKAMEGELRNRKPEVDEAAVEARLNKRDEYWLGEIARVDREWGKVADQYVSTQKSLFDRLAKIEKIAAVNGAANIEVARPAPVAVKREGRRGERPSSALSLPSSGAALGKGDLKLGGGALRMVQQLADRSPAGFTESQWATLAKLKKSGGTWSTYKSKLVTAGLVECRGELWFATDAAVAAFGDPSRVPTSPAELLDDWKAKIGGGPGRLLEAIVANPGIDREVLGEITGLTTSGGTFSTYLSKLRANGLITESDGFWPAEEFTG